MRRTIEIAASFFFLLASIDAGAQDQDTLEQAKTYFEVGKRAYDAGEYLGAARAFGEAYALSPRPAIAFSMAQAYRLQYFVDRDAKKLKKAVELYRKYLDDVARGGRRDDATEHLASLEPVLARLEAGGAIESAEIQAKTQLMVSAQVGEAKASIDGGEPMEVPLIVEVEAGKHKVRVEADGYFEVESEPMAVEGRLVVYDAKLEERPAEVTIVAPDGADVSLGGRPMGSTPFAAPIKVPSGRHFLAVTDTGSYPFAQEIEVSKGENTTIQVELETTTQRVVAYGFLAGGALLLGGGGVGTAIALSKDSAAEEILTKPDRGESRSPEDVTRYNSLRNQRDKFVLGSALLYGAGAASAVTGLLLYFLDSPRIERVPQSSGVDVVPTVSADGVEASVRGRF